MKVEAQTLYSVADVRRLFFPSRSVRWIKDTFTGGDYGPVMKDGGGWMISAAAVAAYQAQVQVVDLAAVRTGVGTGNLKQFA